MKIKVYLDEKEIRRWQWEKKKKKAKKGRDKKSLKR